MKIEILASVMNQKNKHFIVDRMGIGSDDKCLIINQITKDIKPIKDNRDSRHRFLSFKEKGLSKSRNHALENATGDICLICDDDVTYVPNYKEIVEDAYKKYPDADIITFDFIGSDGVRETIRDGKVGFLMSMKASSTEITFKRKAIIKSNIKFDENFGTGSDKYNWGEENIFLFDCLRAGLKFYHVPKIILTKGDFGTTWDRSNTPEHYKQQGAIFYRMSSRLWKILILQYALRKRKIYVKDMKMMDVYRSMIHGAKAYREGRRNG